MQPPTTNVISLFFEKNFILKIINNIKGKIK